MVGSNGTGTFAGEVAVEGTLTLSYLLDEDGQEEREEEKNGGCRSAARTDSRTRRESTRGREDWSRQEMPTPSPARSLLTPALW